MPRDQTFATAVHITTALAFHPADWVTSQQLAMGIQTNAALIRRILCKLASAGIVETKSGPQGGARLAKRAKDLTLADVYESVVEEPAIALSDREQYGPCPISCNLMSVLEGTFEKAEHAMRKELKRTSIADVLAKIPDLPKTG